MMMMNNKNTTTAKDKSNNNNNPFRIILSRLIKKKILLLLRFLVILIVIAAIQRKQKKNNRSSNYTFLVVRAWIFTPTTTTTTANRNRNRLLLQPEQQQQPRCCSCWGYRHRQQKRRRSVMRLNSNSILEDDDDDIISNTNDNHNVHNNNHNHDDTKHLLLDDDLNILVIDHYDSFTYNLVDMLKAQICVRPPVVVVGSNTASTWDELQYKLNVTATADVNFDGIILSPGPGTPHEVKLSLDIVQNLPSNIPILGVCLGHQVLGLAYNATVQPLQQSSLEQQSSEQHESNCQEENEQIQQLRPIHGQVWNMYPPGEGAPLSSPLLHGVFDDDTKHVQATRYHSLHVANLINSDDLKPLLYSQHDNVIMAFESASRPHYGVQFHPESIGTSDKLGSRLVSNFLSICYQYKQRQRRGRINDRPQPSNNNNGIIKVQQPKDGIDAAISSKKVNGEGGSGSGGDSNSGSRRNNNDVVYVHKVDPSASIQIIKPDEVMDNFLSDTQYSFWLDTHDNEDSDQAGSSTSPAISILGTSSYEHGHLVEYYNELNNKTGTAGQELHYCHLNGTTTSQVDNATDILTFLHQYHSAPTNHVTLVSFNDDDHDDKLKNHPTAELTEYSEEQLLLNPETTLPFDYRGGHVGYLGYEVRHDTAKYLIDQEEFGVVTLETERSSHQNGISNIGEKKGPVPTAAFLWADRSFVYDHNRSDWYLIGVASTNEDNAKKDTLSWMRETAAKMRFYSKKKLVIEPQPSPMDGTNSNIDSTSIRPRGHPSFIPNRSKDTYNRNFDQCLEYIRQGESYELCLTNHLEAKGVHVSPGSSPLDFYSVLRRRNPAPHSAFFNWNSCGGSSSSNQKMGGSTTYPKTNNAGSLAICCTSPERFVSVRRKSSLADSTSPENFKLQVEAKPIKGTCARVMPANGSTRSPQEEIQDTLRAEALKLSVKNRAENLMIVDLLRNDLNRVCETGSVHVSTLMGIESFATVHQMVSTIRGTLNPDVSSAVDVLRACFPGGSMTGAPKLRTMELLNEIEEAVPRGPYSGCLGYISTNGCMDMNIIIRTALFTPAATASNTPSDHENEESCWDITIGAGGAITALSESEDEYDEMTLKASAVINAVQEWASEYAQAPTKKPTRDATNSKID